MAKLLRQNALAIFQNNVPVQCIEIGLLARLNAAISPDLIMHIDPETIDSVIPESSEIRLERNGLKAKQGNVAVHAEKVGHLSHLYSLRLSANHHSV